MDQLDEPLRVLLTVLALSGTVYALLNWRTARSDEKALMASSFYQNSLLRIIAHGYVVDQLRVALAQFCLFIGGLFLLSVPSDARLHSASTVGLFLSLLAASTLLAFKSFGQNRRRKQVASLLRSP